MRIRIAVEGSRGDVQPMTALGLALVERGHDVAICSSPDSREFVERTGLAHRPVGCDVQAYLSQHASAVTRGGLRMGVAAQRYLQMSLERQFAELPAAAADADFVIGAGVQTAAASVAELLGVPYRYCLYTPILMPSAEYPAPILPWQSLPIWMNRLSWRMFNRLIEFGLRRPINRQRARLGLAPVDSVERYLLTERPVVAVDEEWTPVPSDCPLLHDTIGYLHPPGDSPLPEKLCDFIASGTAPVYFGFGSMTDPDPQHTTGMLLEAIERVGCRAVVSKGWAGLGDGALPENVFQAGPTNHARLFRRMAAVVHHGGAGTTSTAARAGVPQLVVPHLADQFYHGNRVQLMGLGPTPLPRNQLTSNALAERLRAMLDNEILDERAAELGRQLRSRPPFDLTPFLIDPDDSPAT